MVALIEGHVMSSQDADATQGESNNIYTGAKHLHGILETDEHHSVRLLLPSHPGPDSKVRVAAGRSMVRQKL